jgi:preprotein translocase subunit YajC
MKIGDRVQAIDGQSGTIVAASERDGWIVRFDDGEEFFVSTDFLRLVELPQQQSRV